MSKQRENVRRREKRARKAERIYIIKHVAEAFNALESIGSDRSQIIRRAERRSQTFVLVEVDEKTETTKVIHETFTSISQTDFLRMETLKKLVDKKAYAYNELETQLAVAAGMEQIRLRQQQQELRPELCGHWFELRNLLLDRLAVAPLGRFLTNLCTGLVEGDRPAPA